MKPLNFALCVVLGSGGLSAQKRIWQPTPGHTQIPIWPGAAPDPQPVAGPEFAAASGKDFLVAGRPVVGVSNVSRPTMTVYSPQGKNTGAAVVVFPGGGYQGLAIDLEGTEVCDWLTPKGITCVLLKYRVTDVGPYPKSGPYPESPMALEDAQRTVGLVRFHAAEWHIDPHKIGVLGFSAGGHLSAAMSTHFNDTFISGCRCRRQRELPSRFRSGYFSGPSVAFRGGMGCQAGHQEICGPSSGSSFDCR